MVFKPFYLCKTQYLRALKINRIMGSFEKNKWTLLLLMALTWGSSFILIKRALLVFSPLEIGAFRVGMSGLLLAIIGIPALRKQNWTTIFWIALAGLFGIFL